jgi:HlyD family secretion protein
MKCCLIISAVFLLAACGEHSADRWLGFVEGETVRVASPIGGQLHSLQAQRGQAIALGAPLFVLEQVREQAQVTEAEHRLAAAQAQVLNQSGNAISQKLSVLQAQLAQARTQLQLAEAQFRRRQDLLSKGLASEEQLDLARSDRDRSRSRVTELNAMLRSGSEDVAAAEAALTQAHWALAQKTVAAPAAGMVEDVYYRVGEQVLAGAPVLSLLPPENRKLIFFVPQAELAQVAPGTPVLVHCDGCATEIGATVYYVAQQAEYTPPVIFSESARQKLVFRVEARPESSASPGLRPGQPVDVRLAGSAQSP